MIVACLSDLHGNLPNIPDCDLLILAGDYCRHHDDHFWYRNIFWPWVDENAKKCKIVGVAGNHDWIFQEYPENVPPMEWSYLEDSGIEWNGLKIWGSPWQPRFFDWAFNADEPDLERIWEKIPDDTDILVLHGPPHGYGDKAPRVNAAGFEHTGSPSLLERIKAIKPKLAVAGHIHSGYGIYEIGETIFVNASLVNEKYIPTNAVITIEL